MTSKVVATTQPQMQEQSRQRDQRILQIPLGGNEWVAIQISTPITESAWAQMLAVLEAMKPGLIEPANVERQEA